MAKKDKESPDSISKASTHACGVGIYFYFIRPSRRAEKCHKPNRFFGDHKPKNLIETSQWPAWVWVAWIERGQQTLGTEIRAKNHSNPSLIHNSNTDPDDVRAGLSLPTDSLCLDDLNVFAIALLLNKPCLWCLCVQSSIIKRTAHIHLVHLFGTLLDFLTW